MTRKRTFLTSTKTTSCGIPSTNLFNSLVLIDTSECGDLSSGIRLRDYRKYGDFAPLTKDDQLNISVNIYEEERVVQVSIFYSANNNE